MLRRSVLAGVVAALALTSVVPSYADHDNGNGNGKSQDHRKHEKGPKKPHPKHDPCTDPFSSAQVVHLSPVDGHEVKALVALPAQDPRGIVVFDHGYGHTMDSWREHVSRTASDLGVIAIAPNYHRQTDNRGWWVAEGAQDTIDYAEHFEELCSPGGTNVIYGVSMGGNTSGLVVAAKPKRPGSDKPLFDYWVDVEGAVNVSETYAGARALAGASKTARQAQKDIETAFGGTPLQVPEAYAERTVVNRTDDIARAGLTGVYVVHGLVDGLVPYNQSRELQALLRARDVPVDFWTAVTKKEDTEAGTTLDGYLPTGHDSPFAGHASETSMEHVVGLAGFAALDHIYSGAEFTCGETVYDGTADSVGDQNGSVGATSTGC
jgi:acetyl esterase/lipase